MTVDGNILIRGGLIADPYSGKAENLDLLISDGRITSVGRPGTLSADGFAVHDAGDRLILPGFVNSHTHGHASLMKGVADCWTLEASLTNGPWLGGQRDPETMYLSTLLAAIDMLTKGCTTCFDLVYEFPRPTVTGFAAVAQAYADAGMRAILAPMVADKGLYEAIPGLLAALPSDLRERLGGARLASGDETIAAVETIMAGAKNLPHGISAAIAPTIPHHCSEKFLMDCVAIADRYDLPIHMHVAESRLQVLAAHKLYGRSPVAYLAELGVLRRKFVAAHAVWLDEDDLDCLAEHSCAIAHIPASNLRLGSGIAHIRPMLDRGITVGLATDGANSSDALSMLQAIRLASYGARAFAGSRNAWPTAVETLRLATAGGADLAGLNNGGRIAEGGLADFVFFDLGHVDFLPLTDPFNQIVTCADSASVTDVMIGGRFVVCQTRIVSLDTADLRDRIATTVERLRSALDGARSLALQIEPHVVAFAESMASEPLGIERLIRADRRGRQ
jgi:5-methylthioadenosine/S-adenosylhomocysteine deaminase